jgi:hypothetical protein
MHIPYESTPTSSLRPRNSEKTANGNKQSRSFEMDSFQYHPLHDDVSREEIRLIELLPGQGSNEIRCHIKHVSMMDELRYEALSYWYGDATARVPILCDSAPLNITQNLHLALRQLRDVGKSRLLWADAVWINQSDVGERSSQVQLMRSIFRKAQRVLIWLGEAADGSDEAMALAQRLAKADSTTEIPMFSFTGAGILPLSHDIWEYLFTLFRRPYFNCAWVVQEVALSQDATILI